MPCYDDNILFIDASNEFEKTGNKNTLANENIAKIVDTYRERKTIDKYSYVARLGEVKENDYNLNIPRYVDTFEAEAEIDIETIAKELKTLDEAIKVTDSTIAQFCKELNIATPF